MFQVRLSFIYFQGSVDVDVALALWLAFPGTQNGNRNVKEKFLICHYLRLAAREDHTITINQQPSAGGKLA
jgi:hypothetical protein